MRTPLAVLGLLLITSCTAGHSATSSGGKSPTTIAIGQSDSRTALPASTTPATAVPSASLTTSMPSPPPSTTTTTRASSGAPTPGTQQVVLRPVTNTGSLAPGYTLVVQSSQDQLSCGGSAAAASPSPVAVDDGIALCYPAAAYAVACWPGPTQTTAWCFGNPWQRQVEQIATQGRLTSVRAPRHPSPLGLQLSDGTRCWLRIGGAWAELDGHPELFGKYGCDHGLGVWGAHSGDGIDRSTSTWTVRLAPMSGHGGLRTVTVRTAYYVGTATT